MPTPTTGTWNLRIATKSSQTGSWASTVAGGGASPDPTSADITSILQDSGGLPNTRTRPAFETQLFCFPTSFGYFVTPGTFTYYADPAANITLNPGTVDEEVVATNNLPVGFQTETITVNCRYSKSDTGSAQVVRLMHDGNTVFSSGADFSMGTRSGSRTPTPGPAFTLSMRNGLIGIEIDASDNTSAATGCGVLPYCDLSMDIDYLDLTGTYQLLNYRWIYRPTEDVILSEDLPFTGEEFEQINLDTDPIPDGFFLAPEGDEPLWWQYITPEDGEFWLYQINSPGAGWTSHAAPSHYGWWDGREEGFRGQSLIIVNAVPKRPRTFEEIAAFATGSASPFGGHPGPGVNWRSRMVYARGGYAVGTDFPAIGIFDGLSDRVLTTLPATPSGDPPKAIMSMLVNGNDIYLTTLDSGADATDWDGRVFSLDVNSALLTQIAEFGGGEVPYTLAFHNGRLWLGTNTGDPSVPGKIYWYRPGIDTAFTEDYDLASSSVGGACCMASFQGKLYVGTSADTGDGAKILVRDAVGAWDVTAIGSGTSDNNAYLSLSVYPPTLPTFAGDPQLYASYWDDGTPDTSSIIRYSGTGFWSEVYAGAGDTLIPFIALVPAAEQLYAIGGSYDRPIQLLLASSGDDWASLTAFLPPGDEAATNILVEINR